ncbi:t1pks [Epichloe festucae Fl1]|uniref:T1pks n=1 Tax=Epichloe festucae (strain Fl1) TaxID=877507 RepID=A0A7S9KP15_EPIFF|nr:t1pks [Epichloe festucae Fl1]
MEDIAVIGLGLRFPGNAKNPEELWGVLEKGESQWCEIPKERVNIDGYFHPSGDRLGSIPFRGAHLIKENIAAFDAPFFSVTSEDAQAIDPQQRMLLEVSYEALENAGLRKEDIGGTDACVYVGSFVKDYEQICLRDPDWAPQYAATGNGVAIMANRISYFFDLHGPSMTIDTGCSGSLVSVHLGAQSLRNKESSIAIAAGAGMILTPSTMMPMTALNFLSPDGKCFTFDSRANGYGRGEGIGVVIMKRLSDAIRDNDTIRAVIRGSSVNQDGRTTGITLPSKEAQVANIRSVYRNAGLDFDQTAYVECHGTGTQAGDWRELKAISETLAADRSPQKPVLVGSVKPNIGHLEGAAGVAGMIKGVLVLEKGKIPPNINFESGNPTIDFEDWKVKVPLSVMNWPIPGLRRVSVNCFGFGGTNAHVILDEAPQYLQSRGLIAHHNSMDGSSCQRETDVMAGKPTNEYQLFCYSASEKNGVIRTMSSHSGYIKTRQEASATELLKDYSYTLCCRRSALEWKGFVIAKSVSELTAKLDTSGSTNVVRSLRKAEPRIAFIFSGQGTQWAQMGLELMAFDVFRHSLEEASAYIRQVLQSPFDLLLEMFRDDSESAISYPHLSQPATTAIQVALVDLFRSFGIDPKHVVGHSSGEIAAAYAGGGISRFAAWEIAYFRGMAAISIPFRAPKLKGAMMAVGMSLSDMTSYLESGSLSAEVACVNSPRSVTVSGRVESIVAIAEDLASRKIFHRILNVQTAYHSSHMRLVAHDYRDSLATIETQDLLPGINMFSSVTGRRVTGAELGAQYWTENMVSPVQYVAAISEMMSLPAGKWPNIILELSPRGGLRSPTAEIMSSILGEATHPAYYSVMQPKGSGISRLLSVIGELWVKGVPVNLKQVVTRGHAAMPKCLSDLPPYPWNHTVSYWHESHLSVANRQREYPRQDLIGSLTADSNPFEPRWRGFLRISENPWIQDHQVQKTIVYPAAGMISMALEGAKQIKPQSVGFIGYQITDMNIAKAMIVPNTPHGLEVALNIKVNSEGTHEFSIYSKQLDGPWEQHASGFLQFRHSVGDAVKSSLAYETEREELTRICKKTVNTRQLYELLDTIGMNYGPTFQNMFDLTQGDGACSYKVSVPDTKSKMPSKFEYPHIIHPATLDSMFHSLFAIETTPMVPTFFKSVFISAAVNQNGPQIFSGYATASKVGLQDARAKVVMSAADSMEPHVIIEGLHLTALSTSAADPGAFLPNFRNLSTEIEWREDVTFTSVSDTVQLLDLLAHKYPGLSILQVGGSLKAAVKILEQLASTEEDTPRLSRFTLLASPESGVSSELSSFIKGSRMEPFVERKNTVTEIVSDYHLIICHGDTELRSNELQDHLKAGGILIRHEPSKLTSHSGMNDHNEANGAQHQDNTRGHIATNMTMYKRAAIVKAAPPKIIILTPEAVNDDILTFVQSVRDFVTGDGERYSVAALTSDEILKHAFLFSESVVISLLDVYPSQEHQSSILRWDEEHFNLFKTVQRSAKGLVWITRGSHMKPTSLQGSMIIGLSRVLMSEDPRRSIVTFDLDIESGLADSGITNNIMAVFSRTFCEEGGASSYLETEYAEANGKIFVPRLKPIRSLNQIIEGCSPRIIKNRSFHVNSPLCESEPEMKLILLKSGLSDDSWQYAEFHLPEIKPNDIDIKFAETVLTFQDVETLLGHGVESAMGMDVRGIVKAVGSKVTTFVPGDEVVALVPSDSIKSTIRVKSHLVQRPKGSASFPSLITSAYYALVHMGRAKPGKTILIRGGASAHGLAAIQIAKLIGVNILASVTGEDCNEQRRTLESHEVPAGSIFNAESNDFVRDILNASGGKGVDVIYDTTPGNAATNTKCVKRGGVIVQLTSETAHSGGHNINMGSSCVTVVNFDIRQLLRDDEAFVAELMEAAFQFLSDKQRRDTISPSDITSFRVDTLGDALRHVQKAPFHGLCTISSASENKGIVPVVCKEMAKSLDDAIDPDGTYLLAGGLGGLGRSVSELLVTHGAKHLAFVSRSGASSASSQSFIKDLQERGVDAKAYSVDICDETALRTIIKDKISSEMPPIRGVFQCAAVIRDGMFDNMTHQSWTSAIEPKVIGSWNLVKAMPGGIDSPFYVFLASSAGVIGNRGQANYAAGNSFQDALAHHCRLQGKHAVSIDLGPVLGAGMLTGDEEVLDKLRANGFYGIRHDDFLSVVKHAITMEMGPMRTSTPAQVILGVGTGGLLRQNKPADPYWSRTALYAYLNLIDMPPPDLTSSGADGRAIDLKTALARAPSAEAAAALVRNGLANMLAKAMSMLPEEVDVNRPPNTYGVDSLVAVGVRNWVLGNCTVEVSVFEVLSNDTISQMASTIADRGGYGCVKS